MNIPFAKTAFASQFSSLSTAIALAIGGMITTLEAAPADMRIAEIERATLVTYADAQQKEKAKACIKAVNKYISILDRVLISLDNEQTVPDSLKSEKLSDQYKGFCDIEDAMDAQLVKAKLQHTHLVPETRQARKLLGIARIKLARVIAEVHRIEGNTQNFESDIDMQGFYALSDARNDQIGKRYH